MMAGSTGALQSEAGYIDARPQIRQIDENLLRRTAGPYIGSISALRRCPLNVRVARENGHSADKLAGPSGAMAARLFPKKAWQPPACSNSLPAPANLGTS